MTAPAVEDDEGGEVEVEGWIVEAKGEENEKEIREELSILSVSPSSASECCVNRLHS